MNGKSNLENRNFTTKAEELKAHIEWGEHSGDQTRVQAVNETRQAISEMGFSETSLGHISRASAQRANGKMAIASYEPGTGRTNLGELEIIMEIAANIGQSVRQTTKEILGHEKKHKKADEVQGANETNQTIAYLFGEDAVHEIEEAMASLGTTEKFDAYNAERSAAQGYAQRIGMSLAELSEAKENGRYEKIAEAGSKADLIKIKINQTSANSSEYKISKKAA